METFSFFLMILSLSTTIVTMAIAAIDGTAPSAGSVTAPPPADLTKLQKTVTHHTSKPDLFAHSIKYYPPYYHQQPAPLQYVPVQILQKPVYMLGAGGAGGQMAHAMIILMPQNLFYGGGGGHYHHQHPLLSYFNHSPRYQYVTTPPPPITTVAPSPIPHYNTMYHHQQQPQPATSMALAHLAHYYGAGPSVAPPPPRTTAPLVTGFENFTPDQQAQIRAHLAAHLGTNYHTLGAVNQPTQQQHAQNSRFSDFMPSQQIKSASITSEGATDAALIGQQQYVDLLKNQYHKG